MQDDNEGGWVCWFAGEPEPEGELGQEAELTVGGVWVG